MRLFHVRAQAPEVLDGSRYNASVDVYSYAITVFECACGGDSARNQFRSQPSYAVCEGWRPRPPESLKKKHPLLMSLIQECWRSEQTSVKGALASVLSADVAKRPNFMAIIGRLESMRPFALLHHDPPPLALQSLLPSQQSLPSLKSEPSHAMFESEEVEAARARHRDSPKRFACFLSHHKQACAAEARLVKLQLESLLDAKVFLGM